MTRLPSPIEGFAVEAVGRLQVVIDRSWTRDNSNVWELVNDAGDHFYLKQHPTARFHEREVTAYRLWTAALGPGRAPVMLAADAELRSIVVTAIPGHPARGLQMPTDIESEIHRQAGMLLRRLHDAAPPAAARRAPNESQRAPKAIFGDPAASSNQLRSASSAITPPTSKRLRP